MITPTKLLAIGLVLPVLLACSPTIQVKAPSEPITINLNIKIEHEIKIRVDKALENLFETQSDIF